MTTENTATAPSCGSACTEGHTYADCCLLAPLYPSAATDEQLLAALENIRRWRHRQPHRDAPHFAELDAILDAAALGRIRREVGEDVPTSLPEAVTAHHRIMAARRRSLEDSRRVWDAAEADAIRQIARFMPVSGAGR